VAIWLDRTIATCLTSYNPISSRVISATIAATPRNFTIIQCYAPTADGLDEEVDQFYREVRQVLVETPSSNLSSLQVTLTLELERVQRRRRFLAGTATEREMTEVSC
jgi:hypothetical protein